MTDFEITFKNLPIEELKIFDLEEISVLKNSYWINDIDELMTATCGLEKLDSIIDHEKATVVEEKIYPGYVLVDMIVTDASWYVVRNTPNVTGFIGLGITPTPVDPAEIEMLKKRMGVAEPKYKIDVKAGDAVKITDGPFKDFDGKVDEVDEAKGKIKVLVSIFGRETPVELDFLQINKI